MEYLLVEEDPVTAISSCGGELLVLNVASPVNSTPLRPMYVPLQLPYV